MNALAPKVSIVIPSLNTAKFYKECIESVLHQSLEDIEVICVDAHSDDGTLEIIKDYQQKDPRVHLIVSDKRSYGYQMNLGIKAARGEYLGIVESDDYIEKDMYKKLYDLAHKYKLDVLKCDLLSFYGEKKEERKFIYEHICYDKTLYEKLFDEQVLETESAGALYKLFLKDTWNMNPPGLYSLNFLRKFRLKFNESAGASYQDTGFWFQMQILAKRIYFHKQAYYCYRRDNENSSVHSKGKVYAICEEFDFIKAFLKQYPKLEKEYITLFSYLRFGAYNWNLNRIGDEYKLEFLYKFQEDFLRIKAANELDFVYFEDWQRQRLERILKNPKEFYEELYLKPQGAVLRVKNHLAYKFGQTFLNARNPKRILLLPWDIAKAGLGHYFEKLVYKQMIKINPALKLIPLENYGDYEEALRVKKHLSYRLGQAFLKNPFSFIFKIPKIYKEFKIQKRRAGVKTP